MNKISRFIFPLLTILLVGCNEESSTSIIEDTNTTDNTEVTSNIPDYQEVPTFVNSLTLDQVNEAIDEAKKSISLITSITANVYMNEFEYESLEKEPTQTTDYYIGQKRSTYENDVSTIEILTRDKFDQVNSDYYDKELGFASHTYNFLNGDKSQILTRTKYVNEDEITVKQTVMDNTEENYAKTFNVSTDLTIDTLSSETDTYTMGTLEDGSVYCRSVSVLMDKETTFLEKTVHHKNEIIADFNIKDNLLTKISFYVINDYFDSETNKTYINGILYCVNEISYEKIGNFNKALIPAITL